MQWRSQRGHNVVKDEKIKKKSKKNRNSDYNYAWEHITVTIRCAWFWNVTVRYFGSKSLSKIALVGTLICCELSQKAVKHLHMPTAFDSITTYFITPLISTAYCSWQLSVVLEMLRRHDREHPLLDLEFDVCYMFSNAMLRKKRCVWKKRYLTQDCNISSYIIS